MRAPDQPPAPPRDPPPRSKPARPSHPRPSRRHGGGLGASGARWPLRRAARPAARPGWPGSALGAIFRTPGQRGLCRPEPAPAQPGAAVARQRRELQRPCRRAQPAAAVGARPVPAAGQPARLEPDRSRGAAAHALAQPRHGRPLRRTRTAAPWLAAAGAGAGPPRLPARHARGRSAGADLAAHHRIRFGARPRRALVGAVAAHPGPARFGLSAGKPHRHCAPVPASLCLHAGAAPSGQLQGADAGLANALAARDRGAHGLAHRRPPHPQLL